MKREPGGIDRLREPGTEKSCPACGTSSLPAASFCHACGAHLEWTMAERRIITVVFADLSGFTGLTERLDAEQVHSLITLWLDPVCEAVVRWGGHVDKFIGDCVMALFGAPVAYENEPERAVRAALDMQQAFDEQVVVEHAAAAGIGDYRPRLTIGVNTGPVVTGVFASGGAWDYTAIGDTVNVASRLQGMCQPGGVLVGETTWQQTRHLFEFGDELVLRVKGRTEPVRARQVTGVRERRGKARGFGEVEIPLVGRESSLRSLREAWRRAEDGHPTTCLVVGDAGIGKSRLVAELVAREKLPDAACARGRCYPYASSTPWEPVAELLRDLHGIRRDRPATEAVARIARRSSSPWSEDEQAGLSAVLGSPASELQSLSDLSPEERREHMARAVVRGLEEGIEAPRLLVMEDVHWADRTTLEFLASLSDLDLEGRFLLVIVSRLPLPSEQELVDLVREFGESEASRRIQLEPMEPAETSELVEAILGPHDLPAELLRTVHEKSGGNPLFIEEIVKVLKSTGVIVSDGGRWRATGSSRDVAIPDSIDSILTTRIDGLDTATRKVLQYAAIVGRRFWSGVLDEALARRSVDRELGELVEASLVLPRTNSALSGQDEYAFQHLMLQEVTYAGLLSSVRAELHGTVATWFEERLGRASPEHDDWIAYHFERSENPRRALPYLRRAIDEARDRGALLDAEALVDRARDVVTDRVDEVYFERVAEELAVSTGDDERRREAIERLTELARAADDRATMADATQRRARRLLDTGELQEARNAALAALEMFRELDDGSREADALRLLGRVAHVQGSHEEALERYRAALPLERRAGDRHGEAEILRSIGRTEVDFGNFTRALEHFDQALGIYAELGERPGQAMALADRAMAFRWLGCYAEAEDAAVRAEQVARDCGSRSALAAATLARATAIGAVGRTEEARALLHALVTSASELRRPRLEATAWLTLGRLESGEKASEAVKRARWIAARSGFADVEILGLTRLAELALETGQTEAAERDSGRAIELLERHGEVRGPDEWVYHVRSRILTALGRSDDAARAHARAREIVRATAGAIEDEGWRSSYLASAEPRSVEEEGRP